MPEFGLGLVFITYASSVENPQLFAGDLWVIFGRIGIACRMLKRWIANQGGIFRRANRRKRTTVFSLLDLEICRLGVLSTIGLISWFAAVICKRSRAKAVLYALSGICYNTRHYIHTPQGCTVDRSANALTSVPLFFLIWCGREFRARRIHSCKPFGGVT
jgi:hypothetical protein